MRNTNVGKMNRTGRKRQTKRKFLEEESDGIKSDLQIEEIEETEEKDELLNQPNVVLKTTSSPSSSSTALVVTSTVKTLSTSGLDNTNTVSTIDPILGVCRVKPTASSMPSSATPISEPTIDGSMKWSEIQLMPSGKIGFLQRQDGVKMAFGKVYLHWNDSGVSEEPRFAIRDVRAMKYGVSKFEDTNGGDPKISLAIPINEKLEADAVMANNMRMYQCKMFEFLRCNADILNNLGWGALNEDAFQVTHVLKDVSPFHGPGAFEIRVKWEQFKSGMKPGKLFRMTTQLPRKRSKGPSSSTKKWYISESNPMYNIFTVEPGNGIDGSFSASNFYATDAGEWGITFSIRAMRIYPKEAFDCSLAKALLENGGDEEEEDQTLTVFNY